jgi:hypothetical protein
MSLPKGYSVLHEIKDLKEKFEKDGRHCMHMYLPAKMASKVREELHCYYGHDPGEGLMTLFGVSVESVDAPELSFEE